MRRGRWGSYDETLPPCPRCAGDGEPPDEGGVVHQVVLRLSCPRAAAPGRHLAPITVGYACDRPQALADLLINYDPRPGCTCGATLAAGVTATPLTDATA